jgi:hypothetical protein
MGPSALRTGSSDNRSPLGTRHLVKVKGLVILSVKKRIAKTPLPVAGKKPNAKTRFK